MKPYPPPPELDDLVPELNTAVRHDLERLPGPRIDDNHISRLAGRIRIDPIEGQGLAYGLHPRDYTCAAPVPRPEGRTRSARVRIEHGSAAAIRLPRIQHDADAGYLVDTGSAVQRPSGARLEVETP